MKLKYIMIGACLALTLPMQAQKPGVISPRVETYIQEYKFDEAETQLDKDIKQMQRKRQSTIEAEELKLKIARMRSMMQATERIVVIDSFVVDKKDFLSAMKISHESGSIKWFKDFFGKPDEYGCTVYLSELGNKIYYSMPNKDGDLRLYTSDLLGGKWSRATALKGLETDSVQNYPFMLSDGVTLYYGARNEEGLGGYDIYVTRYDADSKEFLKPENLGMPFNSPANDYMYAIDEINNLGWFVSDRRQPENKVCVYVFLPNALRHVYDAYAYDTETLTRLARLMSISDTWESPEVLKEGKERLEAAMNEKVTLEKPKDFDFVINDDLTYTLVAEFQSLEAQKQASWWKEGQADLKKNQETLSQLRDAYARGNADQKNKLRQQILTMETACEKLETTLKEQEKKIRRMEIEYLQKK